MLTKAVLTDRSNQKEVEAFNNLFKVFSDFGKDTVQMKPGDSVLLATMNKFSELFSGNTRLKVTDNVEDKDIKVLPENLRKFAVHNIKKH